MKILYVNHGITLYVRPVLEKICRKGYDIVMLLPKNDNGMLGKGVKLSDTEDNSYTIRYSTSKKQWYGKHALIDLKPILMEENPDVLVLCWPYFLQLFYDKSILRLTKKNNIKIIIHEIPFQTAPFKQLSYYKMHPAYNENMELLSTGIAFKIKTLITMYLRKFIYKHADATLNYCSCAYDILPSYGVNPKSIFVRYNSSDTESLFAVKDKVEKSDRLLKPCPRIIHIGRLVKWKRVDLLIDAFTKIALQFPDCELCIVGDGPETNSLKEQVKTLELTERVNFAGAIYDPFVLGQYMYESTIYVLAGMGGLSINDAMCYSLPVICSVCDGTEKDLITNGVNGLFFKEGDAQDLSLKIAEVLLHPDKAKIMGQKSLDIIRTKINIDTVSQRYMDAFDYVIKNKS